MPWRSLAELVPVVNGAPNVAQLELTYFLSRFVENAFFPEGYVASPDWANAVVLSDAGRELTTRVPGAQENFDTATIHMAAFAYFAHHEILINVSKTDISAIRKCITDDLLGRRLRWPYRYGRLLYDQFNNTYSGSRTDHLIAKEAETLLTETPQGVYQLGQFLLGPLGILESAEDRHLPPTLHLPLWHCSDSGCNAIHPVELISANVPVVKTYNDFANINHDHLGPPAEWSDAIQEARDERLVPGGREHYCLPSLIGDAIIDRERTKLLTRALRTNRSELLRTTLLASKKKGRGSPEELAEQLSPVEQHQLLLLLPDTELAALIDESIRVGDMHIPASETRVARFLPPRRKSSDISSELSSLGIRSAHNRPIVVLASLIHRAYLSLDKIEDLTWRVRRYAPTSARDGLMQHIRLGGPESAVKDLVVSSKPASEMICSQLGVALEPGDDDALVTRILWKCGFDLPRYEDRYARFRKHLAAFNDTLLAVDDLSKEDRRDQVRSSGVNLFVIAEAVLEEIIAYPVWLLCSDHLLGTRMIYDYAQARPMVAQVLGAELESEPKRVAWNSAGENTLGTLLRYLRELISWMKSLSEKPRESLRRADAELPHFATNQYRSFPLLHKELWADCDRTNLRFYADRMSEIAELLFKARLDMIRNGLDHKRDEGRFPGLDEMLACVARIREALERLDVGRCWPKTFWTEERKVDRFGNEDYQLRDYMGRVLLLHGPAWASGLNGVPFGQPVIVAPFNLLGYPNSEILFGVREKSIFSDYWSGYPRRRHIVPNEVENVPRRPTIPPTDG